MVSIDFVLSHAFTTELVGETVKSRFSEELILKSWEALIVTVKLFPLKLISSTVEVCSTSRSTPFTSNWTSPGFSWISAKAIWVLKIEITPK
jgi:hypothetical protein